MADEQATIVDVTAWSERIENPDEQLGARGSTWLVEPGGEDPDGQWIFKPVRTRTVVHPDDPPYFEEDWAEYVATRIGQLLTFRSPKSSWPSEVGAGVISPNFVLDPAHPPTYGNELLFRADPDYPLKAKGEVPGYTPDRCLGLLAGYRPPFGAGPGFTDAADAFAGYLLLDALVANTDRHHENWCVLQHQGTSHLAPCYDLGTCLGFQLTDRERQERLETTDKNRTVKAWCERGVSRAFEGGPGLVDVAVAALQKASDATRSTLRDRLATLDDGRIADVVADVPADRMSQWAGRFAIEILRINRDRLMETLP